MLKEIKFNNFTGFRDVTVDFGKGLNVITGHSGVGKSNLMRAAYAGCTYPKNAPLNFSSRLLDVFMLGNDEALDLVYRGVGQDKFPLGKVSTTYYTNKTKGTSISVHLNPNTVHEDCIVGDVTDWEKKSREFNVAYIPGDESFANVGYRHVGVVVDDLIQHVRRPIPKGHVSKDVMRILKTLQSILPGKPVVPRNHCDEIYLKSVVGTLKFSLMANTQRKLVLLWLLIRNGFLGKKSILFWDSYGAGFSPSIFSPLAHVLLELQKIGVQIILTTCQYLAYTNIDLQQDDDNDVNFCSISVDGINESRFLVKSSGDIGDIVDVSDDAFGSIIGRQITDSATELGK